jgi:hypothetical protein
MLAQLVAPTLLVVVALHQIFLATTADLDPWKGGGFGMFSSARGSESRHAHVFVIENGIEHEVTLDDELEEEEERVLVLPTPARIERFSRLVSEASEGDHPDHTWIRFELFFTSFDPVDLSPTTRLVRTDEFEIARGSHR